MTTGSSPQLRAGGAICAALPGTGWLPPASHHAPDGVGPVLPVGTDSRTSLVPETSPPEMARQHGSPRKAGRSGGPESRPTGDAQQRPQPGTYRRLCAHHLRAAYGSHAVGGQILLGANAALLPTRQAMARPNSSPQCPHAGSLWRGSGMLHAAASHQDASLRPQPQLSTAGHPPHGSSSSSQSEL